MASWWAIPHHWSHRRPAELHRLLDVERQFKRLQMEHELKEKLSGLPLDER